jgi:hypothetical protein
VQPYTRAKDIENKRQKLKEKKGFLSNLPLNGELDVAKTTNEILSSLKQVIIDLKLTDNSRIKNQLPNILKLKLDGKSKELKEKDYNEAMDIILEVQNEVFDMILENDKIFKLYEMRVANMGEHSAMKSITDVMKNKFSIGLGVIGLKFMDDLGQPLKKLSKSMDIGKHAEIDIMNLYCNGDTVNVAFGECKVLQSLQKTSPDQLKKKVKASLDQAERDLSLFLKINPDLSQEDLERINLITLSILPATISDSFNICKDCSNSVVFREDLNPDYKDFDSIADLLHADLSKTSKPGKAAILSQKLLAETIKKPTKESLSIYRRISARIVGLASLYFRKTTKMHSNTKLCV